MTKIPIDVHYQKWAERITFFGGIPSNVLLEETTSQIEFEKFMGNLFESISPGHRFILGVSDTVPPKASLQRLRRIHELVQIKGQLPIVGNPKILKQESELIFEPQKVRESIDHESESNLELIPYCQEMQDAILKGNYEVAVNMVKIALDGHVTPQVMLDQCLLKTMDTIGERFTDGTVFIPEVMLSARALNESMKVLEPHMRQEHGKKSESPLIIIGTVKGDLHDIGKNLVSIMLKSVGFRIKDIGIDVDTDTFVSAVKNRLHLKPSKDAQAIH